MAEVEVVPWERRARLAIMVAVIEANAERVVDALKKTLTEEQRKSPDLALAICAQKIARAAMWTIENGKYEKKDSTSW